VIVVDDGSSDGTCHLAAAAGAEVIRHDTTLGTVVSLADGLAATRAPVVVTLDADGEHNPDDIPLVAAPVERGEADLVFGASDRPVRWLEGVVCKVAAPWAGIPDTGSGFRAFRGDLARSIRIRGKCTCGLLALDARRQGARVSSVRVDFIPVPGRRSPMTSLHIRQLGLIILALFDRQSVTRHDRTAAS
jgi:hypothetical protein